MGERDPNEVYFESMATPKASQNENKQKTNKVYPKSSLNKKKNKKEKGFTKAVNEQQEEEDSDPEPITTQADKNLWRKGYEEGRTAALMVPQHPPRARRSLRVSKEAGGFLGHGFNKFPENQKKGPLFGALHERNMENNFMHNNNMGLPERTQTPDRLLPPDLGANRFNRRGSYDSSAHQ